MVLVEMGLFIRKRRSNTRRGLISRARGLVGLFQAIWEPYTLV